MAQLVYSAWENYIKGELCLWVLQSTPCPKCGGQDIYLLLVNYVESSFGARAWALRERTRAEQCPPSTAAWGLGVRSVENKCSWLAVNVNIKDLYWETPNEMKSTRSKFFKYKLTTNQQNEKNRWTCFLLIGYTPRGSSRDETPEGYVQQFWVIIALCSPHRSKQQQKPC